MCKIIIQSNQNVYNIMDDFLITIGNIVYIGSGTYGSYFREFVDLRKDKP